MSNRAAIAGIGCAPHVHHRRASGGSGSVVVLATAGLSSSLVSATTLAGVGIARDLAAQGEPIRIPHDGAKLLSAQIPSESLLAYLTVLALFPKDGYEAGRWVVWAAAILVSAAAVVVAYLGQRRMLHASGETGKLPKSLVKLPYLPAGAAATAMAIYGLIVPGSPLQQEISSTAYPIVAGSLAVGGGVVISFLAPLLAMGNAAGPEQPRDQPPGPEP